MPSSSSQPRNRTPGMFVYHASEKDCVGQDGEGVQECVICFEEFAVGDEMGRLVCLCKFHKVSLGFLRLGGMSVVMVEMANGELRHAYGNGGLRKAQALALCIQKGKLETMMKLMMMVMMMIDFGFWIGLHSFEGFTYAKASRCALPV